MFHRAGYRSSRPVSVLAIPFDGPEKRFYRKMSCVTGVGIRRAVMQFCLNSLRQLSPSACTRQSYSVTSMRWLHATLQLALYLRLEPVPSWILDKVLPVAYVTRITSFKVIIIKKDEPLVAFQQVQTTSEKSRLKPNSLFILVAE